MGKQEIYDEAINAKKSLNQFKDENLKLKTKIHQAEKEIDKKNKLIQSLAQQIGAQQGLVGTANPSQKRLSSHLVVALKNQVKELRMKMKTRDEELIKLSKNVKITMVQEMDIEMKMFSDECTRLKHIIEELAQERNQRGTAGDIAQIERELYQQSVQINNLKQENQDLANAFQMKETEAKKNQEQANKIQNAISRMQKEAKEGGSNNNVIKERRQEIKKLEKEREELASKAKGEAASLPKIEELRKRERELQLVLAEKDKILSEAKMPRNFKIRNLEEKIHECQAITESKKLKLVSKEEAAELFREARIKLILELFSENTVININKHQNRF